MPGEAVHPQHRRSVGTHADPTATKAIRNIERSAALAKLISTADVRRRRLERLRTMCATGRARAIRLQAGLTQWDVAHAIEAAQSVIQAWEAGVRTPRPTEAAMRYIDLLDELQLNTANVA